MENKKRKAEDNDDSTEREGILRLKPNPQREPVHPRRGQPNPDDYFRRLYEKEPDFKALARQDAQFSTYLRDHGQLDFSEPASVMQLTKTLLTNDFGLKLELPDDRLCPPVPNRHNYILWLKDLMDTTSYEQPGQKRCGLDIGTGASCIYPLLAAVQRPWDFIATDIDVKSLSFAKQNIELNGLQDRIRLMERKPGDALIPVDVLDNSPIDFTMMNPPFYESDADMQSSAQKKSRPPNSACTGAPVEMVCDGGEVAHVGRMLQESLVLKDQVQWYTSMLGKVSSLEALVEQLKAHGIDNYAITEFIQGNKTRRWALGWSFGPMRPAEHVARGMKAGVWKKILPSPLKTDLLTLPSGKSVGALVTQIREVVGSMELISWNWDIELLRGIGRTRENVWSRAWRRRKAHEKNQDLNSVGVSTSKDFEKCHLGFEIVVEQTFIFLFRLRNENVEKEKMSENSRFTPQNKTTNERLSTTTVGLVALSDFRKRRAEVLEQQEKEAREAAAAVSRADASASVSAAPTPPDRSLTGTPNNASDTNTNTEKEERARKKQRKKKALVSFGDDEEEEGEQSLSLGPKENKKKNSKPDTALVSEETNRSTSEGPTSLSHKKKIVNTSVGIIPRALTKAALRKEQEEKDALRKEFLLLQAAVKATEIAIPFVFYDGTNTPGGTVCVKKGDFIWLFLDKSRKVGAKLEVGLADKTSNARRDWARVGVDDLMLVRGSMIIPHHYDFYYFIMNKTTGPGGKLLFDYSAEAPREQPQSTATTGGVSRPGAGPVGPSLRTLEGSSDDPTYTKVVDRRWYQRNKHIYPASVWQEFDPDKDYTAEIQRDPGGNAFFFSK
ncbi:XAP5, circadian clock regulator-domain-containing protein [Podospora australis]|uniref:XAP5, circadian clock regulator-domain-containing protein n=1 Tax=Podospora australis TaxID=1536484 RepID=A0AAN6WQT8_9PEZI|nr:XAP5, circadian clock regulator-domain-containing protein [Podospora australis]